jgi:hypothetical protein
MYLLRRVIRGMLAREMAKYGGAKEPPAQMYPAIPPEPKRAERKISGDGILDLRDKNGE